jgi:ABC-type multidrug transport system ATPase subunit
MSEKILETLMHLFALIANPLDDDAKRRSMISNFLNQLLNKELVQKYLSIYNTAYEESRKKLEKSTPERREGAIAIRITKLCEEINKERQLDQEQRIVVVIQALEFCRSGGENINELELGFIATLADGLNISSEEYTNISQFVLNPFTKIPATPNLLVINGEKLPEELPVKRIHKEMLKGQIWILNVPSVNMYFIRFTRTGELSMNGQLLHQDKVYPISQGSSLKGYNISPIYYWDITMQFLKEEFSTSRVVYEVKNLEYRFKSGEIGIHHMTFQGESGRMIGIMGASGAGKSTLLSVLNGINPPADGEVLINGISIHNESEKIKGLIGYVSQDDLLIEDLTVSENLYFNAKLCFGNLDDQEIRKRVENVLKNLGLFDIRNMKVGSVLNKKISGGQRKRLNISLELIREPAILFLDEPTSGLSSRDSANILDLLKELARKGKLLFIVIHQPSSDIFKMFDKLIILDTGGYMIYNGNPVESIEYFKRKIGQANYNESECYVCGNVNPEQIFDIVETRVFSESGIPTETRRIPPSEWRNMYEAERKTESHEEGGPLPEISFKAPRKLKQFILFSQRDILSKIADFQYLAITLFEAPVLAFFLSFLIRYFDESAKNPHYYLIDNSNLPVYIFMSVVVAIFMGLTGSAEEIIKDRKILKREAFLNLSWNSFLMSKVFVQFAISAIQAFTFVIIGNSITGIKEMTFHYWLILFSCWANANMLGLVISDSFRNVVTIYILIPFLVIPQIILSGVLVKFEKLNPDISSPVSIPIYGEIITARWGYEALAVKQFVDNKYERRFYSYDKEMSMARFRKDYWNSKLKGNLDRIRTAMAHGELDEDFRNDLLLVHNEFKKQVALLPQIRYDSTEELVPEKVNPAIVTSAMNYLDAVRQYYIRKYNDANNMKDSLLTRLELKDKEGFRKLKNEYYNTTLEEFVILKNETQKIIDYKGQIVQKLDPIFRDPEHWLVKAHFYAPRKQVFGHFEPTFIVNLSVIWVSTLILYIALYLRLLKRLLRLGNKLLGRKIRSLDRELM